MSSESFHQLVLNRELERRSAKNTSYSMRALAKSLDVDVAVMSRVLSGERGLSPDVARRLSINLGLPPTETEKFVASACRTTKTAKKLNLKAAKIVQQEVDIDAFSIIADWYHYALLELTFVRNFKPSTKWIGQALGLTAMQANLAIKRLLRVGLLTQVDGTFKKSTNQITTSRKDVTTAALRKHQQQILEKAIFSLENDPLTERSMTGMTFAIDPSKLPQAKAYIEEFSKKMCEILETGSQERVYQLGVCLYPLQSKESIHDNDQK